MRSLFRSLIAVLLVPGLLLDGSFALALAIPQAGSPIALSSRFSDTALEEPLTARFIPDGITRSSTLAVHPLLPRSAGYANPLALKTESWYGGLFASLQAFAGAGEESLKRTFADNHWHVPHEVELMKAIDELYRENLLPEGSNKFQVLYNLILATPEEFAKFVASKVAAWQETKEIIQFIQDSWRQNWNHASNVPLEKSDVTGRVIVNIKDLRREESSREVLFNFVCTVVFHQIQDYFQSTHADVYVVPASGQLTEAEMIRATSTHWIKMAWVLRAGIGPLCEILVDHIMSLEGDWTDPEIPKDVKKSLYQPHREHNENPRGGIPLMMRPTRSAGNEGGLPADVKRIVYVAGGSEVLRPEFTQRMTQFFPKPRWVISVDPAYAVLQRSRHRLPNLLWSPANDPFDPVSMGAVRPIPAEEVGLVLDNVPVIYRQDSTARGNRWHTVYVPSVYAAVREVRPMPEGPTAIVMRSPGTSGQLARNLDLYGDVLHDLKIGDYLYVDDSYLPLRLLPAERLGLAAVPTAAVPRLIAQPDSVISLGVTLYRKTSDVPEKALREAYQIDSALYADFEWFTPEWNSAKFVTTWKDIFIHFTSAEKSDVLLRLDQLLENSAVPEWARRQRREAMRDVFTEQKATATPLERSVAMAVVGLLGKVRDLWRQTNIGISEPSMESTLARLKQLQFSLEEIQMHLILIHQFPDTAAEISQWTATHRTLLRHYARIYKGLKKNVFERLPASGRPRRSLPKRSA